MRRWFLRMWWRKHRRRTAVEKGFFGAARLVALRLKPIRIWILDGIRNRLIPAGDFFLEKKQKRARCSGLPSRFILCRTCRTKPPVWAAFPFASLGRRARHALRVPCGMLEPGSGPAHARNRSGSEGRDDAMRAANAVACGGVVAQAPAGGRAWRGVSGNNSGAVALFASAQEMKGHKTLKLIPALRACTSKRMNPEGSFCLAGLLTPGAKQEAKFGKPRTADGKAACLNHTERRV